MRKLHPNGYLILLITWITLFVTLLVYIQSYTPKNSQKTVEDSTSDITRFFIDEFKLFIQSGYDLAFQLDANKKLFQEYIQQSQTEFHRETLADFGLKSHVVLADKKWNPLQWTMIPNDLLREIKKVNQFHEKGRPIIISSLDGHYLCWIYGLDKETNGLIYQSLGYSNPYFPSSSVPISFTAQLANHLSLSEVPLLLLKHQVVPVGHISFELSDIALTEPIIISFPSSILSFIYENKDRKKLIVGQFLLFVLMIVLIFTVFKYLHRIKLKRNYLFVSLILTTTILFFIGIQLTIGNYLFPPSFLTEAYYLKQQTMGIFTSVYHWILFGWLFSGVGIISLGFDSTSKNEKPSILFFIFWVILSSLLLYSTVVFISNSINAILLDGYVVASRDVFKIGNASFWILSGGMCFIVGALCIIWLSFKVYNIQQIVMNRSVLITIIYVVPLTIFIIISFAWLKHTYHLDILLYAIMFSTALTLTIIKKMKWRFTAGEYAWFFILMLQVMIPIFFMYLRLNEQRLDQVQLNMAIKKANPTDGYMKYLASETGQSIIKNVGLDSVSNFNFLQQENLAYQVWIQSQLSRERIYSRIIFIEVTDSISNSSEWIFGNIPMRDKTSDSTHIQFLLSNLEKNSTNVFITDFRKETFQRVGVILKPTKLNSRFIFFIDVYQPPLITDSGLLGIRTPEETEFQLLHFQSSVYEDAQLKGVSVSVEFPLLLEKEFTDYFLNNKIQTKIVDRNEKKYRLLFYSIGNKSKEIVSVSRQILTYNIYWNLFSEFMIYLIGAFFLIFILIHLTGFIKNNALRMSFKERIYAGVIISSIIPFILLLFILENSLKSHLLNTSQLILNSQLTSINNLNQEQLFGSSPRKDYTMDYLIYRKMELAFSTRQEWVKFNVIPDWIPFQSQIKSLKDFSRPSYLSFQLGSSEYLIGFYPLILSNNQEVIVAIPNLLSKTLVEDEISTARSVIISGYVLFIILLFGFHTVWINWVLNPLNKIRQAFQKLGRQTEVHHIELKGLPEIEEFGKSYNLMVDDLKRYQHSLAHAERQIAWQEMARQVAHEIKNPLTPLKINTQLLIKLFSESSPKFPTTFEKISPLILKEIESIDKIAKTFATYSRMPDRKIEKISVNEIILQQTELFSGEPVKFTLHISEQELFVLGDHDELYRVFTNIIKNAIQAKKENTAKINISVQQLFHLIDIEVTDEGKGISAHTLSKVFEPNFSTKSEGMGLGLSICKKIVEDMKGDLTIESVEDEYTKLKIKFPLYIEPVN